MRRLAIFALLAGAVAVVIRALRRSEPGYSPSGEPVAASTGHASVGEVEKQQDEEPPSGLSETPGTTAPPL